MSARIIRKTQARRDLVRHFVYIGERNFDAATRFLVAAEETFKQLARMPGMGSSFEVRDPKLAGLRVSAISGFENFLIFYRQVGDAIEVIRVLHGSQDIESIFQ